MFEKEKKVNEYEELESKKEENDYEYENNSNSGYFFPDFRKFLR